MLPSIRNRVGVWSVCLVLAILGLGGVDSNSTVFARQTDDVLQIEKDPYEFSHRAHSDDPQSGFKLAMRLISKARKANAPPETVAKLYYSAAFLKRSVAFEDGNFQPCITILNSVLKKPEVYLANYKSAVIYRNCTSLLAAILGLKGDSDAEIELVLKTAAANVDAATQLSNYEKLTIWAGIRMAASDVALGAEDWPAAIEWVKPIIESADEFLKEEEGEYRLAMAVRQQSMFLFKNGLHQESVDLIDSTCEKFENCKSVDPGMRFCWLCMLRGKLLINFGSNTDDPRFVEGFEKYEALRGRVLAYRGSNRRNALRSCMNMDRLALAVSSSMDLDQKFSLIEGWILLFESEPALQDPEFFRFNDLKGMAGSTCNELVRNGDARGKELRKTAATFFEKLEK